MQYLIGILLLIAIVIAVFFAIGFILPIGLCFLVGFVLTKACKMDFGVWFLLTFCIYFLLYIVDLSEYVTYFTVLQNKTLIFFSGVSNAISFYEEDWFIKYLVVLPTAASFISFIVLAVIKIVESFKKEREREERERPQRERPQRERQQRERQQRKREERERKREKWERERPQRERQQREREERERQREERERQRPQKERQQRERQQRERQQRKREERERQKWERERPQREKQRIQKQRIERAQRKLAIANIVNNNLDKLNKLKDQYPLVKNALNETLGKNNILNSFNDKILNEVKIVQSHLSQANHYYKQHTYTLFWENIEKTGKSLSQFEFLVKILESCIHFVKHQDRVVKETNKETLENVKSLCHPIVNKDFLEEERRSKLKLFSIQLAKLDKPFAPPSKFEETILSTKTTVYPVIVEYNKLVLRGLSSHKFALIYEQRAIRESIVGGFKNLGEMVQNVGNQLNDTLTTIDDSIRKEAENNA